MTPRAIAKRRHMPCGDNCTADEDCPGCEDRLVDDIFAFGDLVLHEAAKVAHDEIPTFKGHCPCLGCGIAKTIALRIEGLKVGR